MAVNETELHPELAKADVPAPDPETLNRFLGPPLIDSFMRYCGLEKSAAEQALSDYREYFARCA